MSAGAAPPLTSGPAQGSTIGDPTPTFAFSSDTTTAAFRCRLDDANFSPCSSPQTTAALGDGAHAFRVKATDQAGNPSEVAERDFTVDTSLPAVTSAPEVFFTSGPTGLTNDRTPAFGFAMNEAGSFKCRTDGDRFTACSSPHTTTELNDGPHSFDLRGTDAAGYSSSASRSIVVDTAAPRAEITSAPKKLRLKGKRKRAKARFKFTASESGSDFACKIDGAAFSPCFSPEIVRLGKGIHRFKVRATDRAGNSDSAKATVKVKRKRRG